MSSYEVSEIGGDSYAVEVDDDGTIVRAWGPLDDAVAVIGRDDPAAVQRWLDDFDDRYPDGKTRVVDVRPTGEEGFNGVEIVEPVVELVAPSTRDLAAQLEKG